MSAKQIKWSKKKIFKYQLELGFTELEIPSPFTPRHVDMQMGNICLWAEVDPAKDKKTWRFIIIGTGHETPDSSNQFLGTVVDKANNLVWHVYMQKNQVVKK